MRDRRRDGGGAPYVPPWRRLGPHYSYLADSAYMVLAGGNVERWADELDPANAAKDLQQAALLNQLAYVANAGTPSGAPGVVGDATSKWLEVARTVGLGAGPVTAYTCVRRGPTSPTASIFGEGSTVGTSLARHRTASTLDQSQVDGSIQSAPSAQGPGDSYWFELRFVAGVELVAATAAGDAVLAGAVAAPTDVLSALARIQSGTATQFGDATLLWAFGYPRILTPAERAIARDAAQARIG